MKYPQAAVSGKPAVRPMARPDRNIVLDESTKDVGLFRGPPEFGTFSMDRYASELHGALERLGRTEFVFREIRPAPSALAERLGGRHAPFLVRFIRRFPGPIVAARRSRSAVNHILDHADAHLLYGLDAGRTVVTCHDIFPLKRWRGQIPGIRSVRRRPPVTVMYSLKALTRAAAVITTTTVTREDVIQNLGVSPDRVFVIPYGIDKAFRPLGSGDSQDSGRTPSRLTILAVDTGTVYKNQLATIEVLARVRPALDADVRLVRVGAGLSRESRERATALGVDGAIVELGPVAALDVVSIYGSADVLLFPSYYEGFGWPPLEAMACGLPVVCSTAPAVSEVVAGAALQADPDDHDELARHVIAVLCDKGLARSLKDRGRVRAASFTWERAARETLRIYDQVLGAAA